MTSITVRGCDDALAKALKETSSRRRISVNRLVIETLEEVLLGGGKKPRRFDDLDELAGSWSSEEAEAFARAVSGFETIDAELWKP